MKRFAMSIVVITFLQPAFAGCIGPVIMGECKGTVTPFGANGTQQQPSQPLRPNAYRPGIHQNQYGQPVTLEPRSGGVPGEKLTIQPNTYGSGVHMDQYGRPVREKSWP